MIFLNLEAFPQYIRIPKIHDMHNSQNFLFIDSFVQIVVGQLFTCKGQRLTLLHKDSANSFPESITFQDKGLCEIRKGQDWSGAHGHIQGLTILSRCWIPSERILFKECSESCCNLSIILNKLVIITC
jgi:hypothetical protein